MTTMRMRQLVTALALALSGAEVAALGFGEIEVRSRLNEPLDATIRVSGDAEELASLSVRLAAAEEFARLGLRRQAVAVALDFLVERDERGEAVVRVRSRQPVREPLLPLLVEAQWSRGRMLREFVVLLDPPLTVPAIVRAEPARVEEVPPARSEPIAAPAPEPRPEPAPEPVPEPAPPPVAGPEPAGVPPEQAPAPEPEGAGPRPEEAPAPEPAPQPEAVAPPPAPALAPAEYGPVAAGETLWQIALGTRPADDIAVQQMLLALFEANPEAFIDGNVNLLRRGAVLRIPDAERVRAIDRDEARRVLAEHAEALAARRGAARPVAMAATAEPPPLIAEREARSAPPPPPREDRLAILPPAGEDRPPRAAAGGLPTRDAEIEALRADLQRSRESLAAAEQELGELRSRVRELEGDRGRPAAAHRAQGSRAGGAARAARRDSRSGCVGRRGGRPLAEVRSGPGRAGRPPSVEPAPAEPPPAPAVAEAAPPPARVAPAAAQLPRSPDAARRGASVVSRPEGARRGRPRPGGWRWGSRSSRGAAARPPRPRTAARWRAAW
ncbi:MAG: FimV/HubP family polar landmark protein [Xanthomonadales bacterium]|nr:FimV/HubP family polar landmark protein [Xanthomonadales bacterium]